MMRLHVMIVEDEPLIAMDLEDILKAAGHVVVGIANNMHHALDIAAANALDLAIMDVDLAMGTSGVETARRLRTSHGVASLFVSGRLDEATKSMALEWGPVGFIGKPFDADQIVEVLFSKRPE